MSDFRQYRRKQIAELAQWTPGTDMTDVADKWLVAAVYFADNFEAV